MTRALYAVNAISTIPHLRGTACHILAVILEMAHRLVAPNELSNETAEDERIS